MSDDVSLYSAMYSNDDDVDDPVASAVILPSLSHVTIPVSLRTHRIVTDEATYSVPTLAYVSALERLLEEQSRVIAELRSPNFAATRLERMVTEHARSIRRIEHAISIMRSFIRKQTGKFSDMQNNLDQKIDRRD